MKISKRQRAQVVELLRCAADCDGRFDTVGMVLAGWSLDHVDFISPCSKAYAVADEALGSVFNDLFGRCDLDYRHRLLEAAQRVEEGTWPL